MAAPAKKLNIFQVLGSIGKKNKAYYTNLTDDERKAFFPLVVMRWLSGTSDASQVVMTNEVVNPYTFPLHRHPELLANLLTTASSGTGNRVQWLKMTAKKTSKHPAITAVVADQLGYSTSNADDVIPMLSDDDILGYAEQLGRQPEVIKQLKKELKTRT